MPKYLVYDFENIQPIKISSTVGQIDKEYCESYVYGNIMKGAYVSKYINYNNVKNINEGEHKEKLLKGKMKFYNAYPIEDDKRTYPLPRCFYKSKKKGEEEEIAFGPQEEGGYSRIKSNDFVIFRDGFLERVQVDKENYLHIKVANKEDDTKIFRYESISIGNKFRGIIEFTGENAEENRDECKRILEEKKGEIYVGGSRSSGYGLSKIIKIRYYDNNPEILDFDIKNIERNFDEEGKLYLYATSNIIYRDDKGIYKSFIDEEYIKNKLGLDRVELTDSFIDVETFTGFNNKWGYRLPLIDGIKAGSVIEYEYEGEIDTDKFEKFINEGIGDRKIDGFGRFVILDNMFYTELCNYSKYNSIVENETVLDEDETNQFNIILNKIYRNKLHDKFIENVFNVKKEINIENLKFNQIGKLFRLMTIIEPLNKEKGIEKVNEYFDHIKEKKNNRALTNSINSRAIDEKIISFIQNTSIEDFEKHEGIYPISVDNNSSKIDEEDIYRYKVKILKEVFRLQLRKNNREMI